MQDLFILCWGAAFESLSRICSNTKEYFAEINSPVWENIVYKKKQFILSLQYLIVKNDKIDCL